MLSQPLVEELVAVLFGVVLLRDIYIVVGVCMMSLDVLETSWRRVSSTFEMFLFIDRVAMSSIVLRWLSWIVASLKSPLESMSEELTVVSDDVGVWLVDFPTRVLS